jgi:hypothetical protein
VFEVVVEVEVEVGVVVEVVVVHQSLCHSSLWLSHSVAVVLVPSLALQ